MEELFDVSERRIAKSAGTFTRVDIPGIDWSDRLIAVKGARGTGKTTMLLQYLHQHVPKEKRLYISLDHLYFQSNTLYDTGKRASQEGVRTMVIDEVHKYPNWSVEIKNLYDFYDELQIIFTGSSALEIFRGQGDLSRRAVLYNLPVMSFREFLALDQRINIQPISLDDLLKEHTSIAEELNRKIDLPLKQFRRYLSLGCYPYYRENEGNYHTRLMQTVNLVLETDIAAVTNIPYNSVYKLKKLLAFIADSVPFKPNIVTLSEKIATNRATTVLYLDYLRKARTIHLLNAAGKNLGPMSKPDKIYLDNPNMGYAFTFEKPDTGNLRETFFLSQVYYQHEVNSSESGDFFVNNKYTFEVGGKNKKGRQVKNVKNSYVVADDALIGRGKHIPLWLFGFLY